MGQELLKPRESDVRPLAKPQRPPRFVYLACGLFSAHQASLFGLYAFLAPELGVSLPQLIGAFAFGSFLFLFGQPYWAYKGLVWSRERAILIGQLGQLLSLLALIFLPNIRAHVSPQAMLIFVFASRLVYGLTASAIIPSAQSLLAESSREGEYMRSMTAQSIALNMGRVLGPVSVLILAPWAPAAVLPVYAVLLLACIALAPKTGAKSKVEESSSGGFHLNHLLPDGGAARWIFALALFLTTYVALIQSSLGAAMEIFWGMNPQEVAKEVALLTIIGGLITVAVQTYLRKRIKDPRKGVLMFAGGAAMLASAVVMQNLNQYWQLLLGIIFMALGIAVLVPSYLTAMNLHYAGKSSQAAGNLGVAQTLGFALGGAISALALSHAVHLPFILALLVAVLMCGAVLPIRLLRSPQKGRHL